MKKRRNLLPDAEGGSSGFGKEPQSSEHDIGFFFF